MRPEVGHAHWLAARADSSKVRGLGLGVQAAPDAVHPRNSPGKVCKGQAVVEAPAAGDAGCGLAVLFVIFHNLVVIAADQAVLPWPEQALGEGLLDCSILFTAVCGHLVGDAIHGGVLAVMLGVGCRGGLKGAGKG